MKKTVILTRMVATSFTGLFLLSGCASQQDMRKVNLEMHTLDNRLIEIEESIKEIQKRTGSSVDSVQKKQAGLGNTIDQLNTKLLQNKAQLEESRHRYRSLNAELIRINKKLNQRLDKVENKTASLDEEFSEKTSSLKTEVTEINKELTGMQSGMDSLKDSIASLDQRLKGIKKARLEEKAALARKAAEDASAAREQADEITESTGDLHRIKPEEVKKVLTNDEKEPQSREARQEKVETTESPEPEKPKSEAQQKYERGLEKYRAGDHREAKEIFSDLRKQYAGKGIGIKSRFMVANCLFKLENYSLAILEYQQVISDHPDHDMVPDGLYNQATAFEKLGDKKTADIVYRKVIREFPDSEEAGQAEEKL